MKRDEKKKIWDKDIPALQKEIGSLRSELAHDRLTFQNNKPKDVNVISKKKRKLAIMLTALTEKREAVITK